MDSASWLPQTLMVILKMAILYLLTLRQTGIFGIRLLQRHCPFHPRPATDANAENAVWVEGDGQFGIALFNPFPVSTDWSRNNALLTLYAPITD